MRIAVIGAGLAGLTAATHLQGAGHDVVVWEKSRGAGGRTATRRGPDGLRFDHGAPFLHDGPDPLSGVDALAAYRLTLPGDTVRQEVVGDVSNHAPAKALAAAVEVRTGVRVASVDPAGDGWELTDEHGTGLGAVDAVVVTAPAPQTADLLRTCAPHLAERAASVAFDPCWTAMAAWDHPLDLPFTAATGLHGLAWAVAEAPKPGRLPGERWILQADADLTREHLEAAPDAIAALLMERFAVLAGAALPAPVHVATHRWLYARPAAPLTEPFLQAGTVIAAGDWCGGTTAGAAVRSGRAAAAALLG